MSSVSVDRRFGVNAGMAIKVPCKCATTGAITLSGLQTIDDIACVDGDRVLVMSNTTANGIYEVDSGDWTRAPDFDGTYDVTQGTLIPVYGGTVNGHYVFQVDTASPVIGTSSLTFSVAFDSAQVSAFIATMLDDANAAAVLTTLGISAFIQTLLDDNDAATARATLGVVEPEDIQNQSYTLATTVGGTGDAMVVSVTPAITSYTGGFIVRFKPPSANTAINPTLSVNGLTVKTVYLDNTGTDVSPGMLSAVRRFTFEYFTSLFGSGFILLDPLTPESIASGSVGGTLYKAATQYAL